MSACHDDFPGGHSCDAWCWDCRPSVSAPPRAGNRQLRWVPNGPVFAVARHNGITYVGGQFTMVSPSGAGAPINVANDVIPVGFPPVVGWPLPP
jgi:hypothetical protein